MHGLDGRAVVRLYFPYDYIAAIIVGGMRFIVIFVGSIITLRVVAMKHVVAFLVSILTVVAMSGAGPLRGRLVDFKNKPIKSAKIYVHDLKNFVKPDKQGYFHLEDVNPDDTIYVKWRGRFYGIPVEGSRGVTVKFDREPNNSGYVNMGIMGIVRANNNTTPIHRYATMDMAVEIMKQESLKYYNREEDLVEEAGRDGMTFTSKPFKGQLFDYKNKPIKNARVFTHNPKRYVKTDREGRFALYEVLTTDTIYVKWKGEYYDIPVEGNGMVVKFGKDYPKHRDFVDTGKGLIDARLYNGPRDVRTAKQLEATGESDLIKALKGVSSVLTYYDKDGKLKISIRQGGDPLWIVDGVEMTEFPDITVMEVERVEILKDGALYGTRGMNGVIVVTTKGSGSFDPEKEKN